MSKKKRERHSREHAEVYYWDEFLQGWVQKQIRNLASVKVWGLIFSTIALFWGAITGMVFGDWSKPQELLRLVTREGLLSGGEYATILGVIYGVREVYKIADLKWRKGNANQNHSEKQKAG